MPDARAKGKPNSCFPASRLSIHDTLMTVCRFPLPIGKRVKVRSTEFQIETPTLESKSGGKLSPRRGG
jgi:hypothetical protein